MKKLKILISAVLLVVLSCFAVACRNTETVYTVNDFVVKVTRAQEVFEEITDTLDEYMGKKQYIDAKDFTKLSIEKHDEISEHFKLKKEINEIYKALAEDSIIKETTEVMTAYEELEQTFIDGLYQEAVVFKEQNSKKSEALSRKINNLLLVMM